MTYIVQVEKNYKPFQNCISTIIVDRSCKSPYDYYKELAKGLEKKYKIKSHFGNVNRYETMVWEFLEFESEKDYLVWLIKWG